MARRSPRRWFWQRLPQHSTLAGVKQRGELRCGVGTGLAGFGMPDDKGTWVGLDVDYCRAIAAAIFNDPLKGEVRVAVSQGPLYALCSPVKSMC